MPLSTIQILSSQYELSSQLSPKLGLFGLIKTFSRAVIRRYTLKNVHVYLEGYTSDELKGMACLHKGFSIVSNNATNISEIFHTQMIDHYFGIPKDRAYQKSVLQNIDNFYLILKLDGIGFIVLESSEKHIDDIQVRSLISLKKIFCEHIAACVEKESLRQSHDKLYKQLYFNDLTKLPNRKGLFKAMVWWDKGPRRSITSIMFNIRKFRLYNHQFGYSSGDELLKLIASELKNEFGKTMIYHIGSDEFLAFCEKDDSANAIETEQKRLENFKNRIKHKTLTEDNVSVDLWSCSNNYTHVHQKSLEKFNTLEFAMSLLRANRGGLHLTIDDEIVETFNKDHKIHAALASDLPCEQFHLVFQPQFDITGQIIAAETLIRWKHPALGIIPPDAFIPLLEANQKIVKLDQFVLNQSIKAMSELKKHIASPPKIAINVSSQSFLNDAFYEDLVQKLCGNTDIILELTESAQISDLDYITSKFVELNQAGIEIHLDDFGTGYSSILYLMSFQFGMLKVDKSFIRNIDKDEKKQRIVKSILNLAKSCDLDVLVEGVETRNEFRKCVSLGISKFQGYYFSKPVSWPVFVEMVQAQNEQISQNYSYRNKRKSA